MEIVRNSINIIGIASSDNLPNEINDQIIQYSDVETIFIPQDKPDIDNIFEIMIEIEIKSKRILDTNIGRTVIIDGIKKYKVIYSEESSSKANILYLNTPYNTFIEIPKKFNDCTCNIFIIDAYFSLLSSRKIYSHLLLLVDVNYSTNNFNKDECINNIPTDYDQNYNDKKEEIINKSTDFLKIEDDKNIKEKSNIFDYEAEYL